MNRLKKNLRLQTIYQIIATSIPLLTSPYLSRVLGATGLGIYSYTLSVVNYFSLFAMLGMSSYGCRTIAMAKDQNEEERLFIEIHSLQVLTSFIMTIMYYSTVLFFLHDNQKIAMLQSFWLLACSLDVSWYFFGKEEFQVTVTRNLVIKLITVISIFAFVRTKDDVGTYTFIMAFGSFLSQFVLFCLLKKRVKFCIPEWRGVLSHIKPNLLLFAPILAMSVYHLMDKTMLGMLADYSESGYYYNADKVINIPLGIIGGIGTVMMSKASVLKAEGNDDGGKRILSLSIEGFMCVACAMAFGIASVAKEFVPIFFGQGYDKCVELIILLSVVMIFKSLSNIIQNQYLIPYNKEKMLLVSIIIGAFVNLIINYTFIGIMGKGALGATIGTVIAELVVCLVQYIMSEKDIHLIGKVASSFVYCIFGALMFGTVRLISNIDVNDLLKMLIEITVGGIMYLIMVVLYWYLSKNPLLEQYLKKE